MRKDNFWYVLLASVLVTPLISDLKAQGSLSALTPSIQGPYLPGFVTGGVGWTFTPTADLFVTGISTLYGSQVSIWQSTNQIIETYNYTFTDHLGSVEPIAPLLLSAGQNYAISAQDPNFSSLLLFYVGSPTGTFGLKLVSVSPYLNGFGNFNLSTNRGWTPFGSDNNTDFVSIGPNFQFQVVPEPGTIGLSILGFLVCAWKLKPRCKN